MRKMKKAKKLGFTLVEVSLFLALSGGLVAIVIAGTSRAIAEKRFVDTVDNFDSYLQGLYASANYVRYSTPGTFNQAVYGKLVYMKTENGKTEFKSYTVIAKADLNDLSGSDAYAQLVGNADDTGVTLLKEEPETYVPNWGGTIKLAIDTNKANDKETASILILRNPKTSNFQTFINPNPNPPATDFAVSTEVKKMLTKKGTDEADDSDEFKQRDANFCIDSDDRWAGGNERRLIRIHSGANNASGVELIANDKKEGYCAN